MDRRFGNQKGFSLLELLIAVFLLAVGLVAAVSMQQVAINSNTVSNRLSAGTALAQEVMEDILSLPQNNAAFNAAGTITANYLFGGANVDQPIEGAGVFTATYTIDPKITEETSRITVNVTQLNTNRNVATFIAYKRIPQ